LGVSHSEANIDDTIPRPLLDRMEVIKLSGYITEEKISIAKKYLIPTAKKDHGVSQVT
jgi:ATP-dependent Lon protease